MPLNGPQRALEFTVFRNRKPSSLRATYKVLFVVSDYESLRIGGLVFAVVLFLLGIALIVSKCFCTEVVCCCHHTVILVRATWPRGLPNVHSVAKQAGLCFSHASGGEALHTCSLYNLSTLWSNVPRVTAALSTWSLLSLVVSLPRFFLAACQHVLLLQVGALKPKSTDK